MSKSKPTPEQIRKKAIGLLDNRSTDNDGMLIKRDKTVSMIDLFGSEQMTAVAYYVSDLLAKGFNNQQIIMAVKDRYDLDWNMRKVNLVKDLLHKLWRCETAHAMNDQVARELATIDTQIRETWEAWEFSKRGIKHTKTRTENSDSECDENQYKITEIVNEETTTSGDVKYLQHLNELGKERRKLLGLYAPEKKTPGAGTNNGTINFVVVGSDGNSLSAPVMPVAPTNDVEEANVEIVDDKEGGNEEIDNLFAELMHGS